MADENRAQKACQPSALSFGSHNINYVIGFSIPTVSL